MAYKSKYTGSEIDLLLDKIKGLDDNPSIEVDSALSESSENPVQNKVVTSAINDLKTSLNGLSQSVSDLSEKVEGYSEDIANAVGKSEEATEAVKGITEQINGIIEEVGSLSDKVESLENGEISWTDVQ